MVEVTNGVETFYIPEGAVKVYETMGFMSVSSGRKHVSKTTANNTKSGVDVVDDNAVGDDFEELLQKPISQWNQDEVKEFAAAKGYDVSGAKSLKQAKAIIKDALDLEEKALVEG